jgi:hypothetical protein
MAEPPQQRGTGKHLAGVLAASPDPEGTWEEPTGDPPQLGASGSSLVSRGCQATSAIAAASQFLQDLTAYRESSCSTQPAVPHVYGRNNHWVQQTPGSAAYDWGGRVPLGQPALQNLRRYIQSSVDRQLLGPGHDLSIPLGNTSGPLLSGAGSAPSLKGGGSMLTDASAADPAEGQLQGMGIAGGKTPKKEGELIKGAWTADEDAILLHHVAAVGDSQWNKIQVSCYFPTSLFASLQNSSGCVVPRRILAHVKVVGPFSFTMHDTEHSIHTLCQTGGLLCKSSQHALGLFPQCNWRQKSAHRLSWKLLMFSS